MKIYFKNELEITFDTIPKNMIIVLVAYVKKNLHLKM